MKKNKKLAIIGTVGLPACYGGFETLAEHLVSHLGEEYETTVYCSGKKYPKQERQKTYKGAKLKFLPFSANGIQSIPYDTFSIIHALFRSDVLLVLGVAGAWTFPFVRLFTTKKIIVSIDGIEWKRGKWNRWARLYLWWAEKIAVRYSHIDISDNESIQDYTANRYGTLSNVIEYGADHVFKLKPKAADKKEFPFLKQPYAFSVCRIEPENNLHVILEAFSSMPEYPLVIVGNWAHGDYGRNLLAQYKDSKNIHLLDPIYDQKRLDLLRGNCYLYFHGHSAGGTNPSLVEAMYLGLPVMAYDVSYNRTTTDHKAFFFRNSDDIKTMVCGTRLATLKEQGKTLEAIAIQRYTWKIVAAKYKYLVEKALVTEQKGGIYSSWENVNEQWLLGESLGHLSKQELFFEKR